MATALLQASPFLANFYIIVPMYCAICGNKLVGDEKFCTGCGNEIISNVEESTKVAEDHLSNNQPENPALKLNKLDPEAKIKLEKIYRDTGNSSFALGVFSVFVYIVALFAEINDTGTLFSVVDIILVIPFIYFGIKLKNEGINNLKYAFRISKGLLIYLILLTLLILWSGFWIGWLWLLLLYYFYRSYNGTKKVLA